MSRVLSRLQLEELLSFGEVITPDNESLRPSEHESIIDFKKAAKELLPFQRSMEWSGRLVTPNLAKVVPPRSTLFFRQSALRAPLQAYGVAFDDRKSADNGWFIETDPQANDINALRPVMRFTPHDITVMGDEANHKIDFLQELSPTDISTVGIYATKFCQLRTELQLGQGYNETKRLELDRI